MTMTEYDREYFQRVGGYLGPVKLRTSQVGCPTCGADGDAPCRGSKGPIKRYHPARRDYRDELNERAALENATGRWYRHEFRAGRIPSPPMPCGTPAAYQRHKRHGEEVDEACKEAARKMWRESKRAVRS